MFADLIVLLSDPAILASLATLLVLEIVLGIDNVIFIIVLSERLPEHQRPLARRIGIGAAVIGRLLLLTSIAWIISLKAPVLDLFGKSLSWRDLILIGGGLFLIWKATQEIHHKLEAHEESAGKAVVKATFAGVIMQAMILDLVFSLDSVLTAIGVVDDLEIMVIAVVLAALVMLLAASPLARFISANPTVKMLAYSFLLLIGMVLIADGFHVKVPKGYVYSAIAFSMFVEFLNLMLRRRSEKHNAAKARSDSSE